MDEFTENTQSRAMPRSDESEIAVIGSMLLNNDAIQQASEIISENDFYNKQYAYMFKAMVDMFNEGVSVDEVTLQERLKATDLPPSVTSMKNINDIMEATPTSVKVKNYATIVRDKSLLRRMIKINQEIENDCYSEKEEVEDILEKSEKQIFSLIKDRNIDDYTDIGTIVFQALRKIEIASKKKGPVTGVPTGFSDLDYQTAGLQPSDLILVAARPSMGKTAFALNIAQHTAIKNKIPTVIFSLEMSREQLINRFFALEGGIDAQKLRTGDLTEEEWMILAEAGSNIGASGLIIDDTSSISINNLKSKCRKYKLDHNIGLIIIDYLQLMETGGKVESHQLAIAEISRALKALARELNVPVVALSQLSRNVEKRDDKRPMLSDLRDSGAIEQDADVVMFIYREDYYKKDTERQNVSEIIVAKQRNGPVGTVELAWIPERTQFANKLREPSGQ
ncbi:MAG: replicative DNA helicase [Lachnospiraceae bacterium]|nr:replicative DNA helicase [Lachnospiraceae bacterium]